MPGPLMPSTWLFALMLQFMYTSRLPTEWDVSLKNFDRQLPRTTSEITRSCKDLLMHFPDPTVVDKLHLQLAIVEERYADALK